MKIVVRLLLAIAILIGAVFAIGNRMPVTLSFRPLPFEWSMPLFAAILGAFAIGLVVGTAITTVGRERMRWRARAGERRAESLERAMARKNAPPPQPPAAALPAGPSRTRFTED